MTDLGAVTVRDANWPADAERLRHIRNTVFIQEQGVPETIEWDGQDAEALHVIAELNQNVVGCGRLLPDGRIGRLAVLQDCRGHKVGERLLQRLLQRARKRGEIGVYLHAQTDALGFYERAGFVMRGAPFDEAGISHVDMQLEFDYRNWNEELSQLAFPRPFSQLVVAQALQARRELRIMSPDLDPRLFDQEDLFAGIRQLVRGHRSSRVKILVRDSRAIVQRGHGLLQLARRMPSGIEMRRLAEHPAWGDETEIVRDRDSRLALPSADTGRGFYRPGSPAQAEGAINRFEELWRAGEVDAEFRALAL